MKKVIAAIVALALVFTLCTTSMALLPDDNTHLTKISNLLNGGPTPPNQAFLKSAVNSLLTSINNNYDKELLLYYVNYLNDNGTLKQDGRYEMILAEIEAAADPVNPAFTMPATTTAAPTTAAPTTAAPTTATTTTSGSGENTTSGGSIFDDITLPGMPDINFDDLVSAEDLIQRLKDAGIPASAMQTVVDALHSAGIIDDTMHTDATKLINAGEATTDASNEGGIGDFFGGIFDTISGLFGGDSSTDGSTGGDASSDEFGAGTTTPPGDTTVFAVLGVAAVAGAALLLTKKKKDK